MSLIHITGENSHFRKWALYIFAKYIEVPLLKYTYFLLRGKWKWFGSREIVKYLAGIALARPFGYLGDSAKPMPYDEVIRYMDELDGPIAVGPCRCRIGHMACDHPLETDIVIRTGYDAWMRAFPKEYREITRDEAKDILTKCRDMGMFHMIFIHCPVNHYNEYVICNCCTCGCVPYIINRDLGQKNFPFIDGYYLAITDRKKCRSCGKCLEVCPFEAREMVEGKGKTNRNCFGCGLCAHNCPEKAITMKKLRDPLPRDKEGHAPGNYRPGLYRHHEPVREE